MIDGDCSYREDDVIPALRNCPHCGKKIRWQDFAGLATQAWHYGDSIISQAVIATDGEEIDSLVVRAEQRCGYCQGELREIDWH